TRRWQHRLDRQVTLHHHALSQNGLELVIEEVNRVHRSLGVEVDDLLGNLVSVRKLQMPKQVKVLRNHFDGLVAEGISTLAADGNHRDFLAAMSPQVVVGGPDKISVERPAKAS